MLHASVTFDTRGHRAASGGFELAARELGESFFHDVALAILMIVQMVDDGPYVPRHL
jgi:hypothetical protein